MQPTNIDNLPGRLVDRLADNGIMSRPDAEVTSALRDLHTGTEATRAIDIQALNEASEKAFGFTLPADWIGQVQVQGNVMEGEGDDQHVTSAASLGVEPQFYGVYARREDGTHQWLADFDGEQQADELAQRLAAVDAYAEVNDVERAAKLARVHEERVRRDPNSTDEDISAAKEARKDAEMTVMLNDQDLQNRIAEHEREQQEQAQGATAAPAQQKAEREYINVPFKEKDEAKGPGHAGIVSNSPGTCRRASIPHRLPNGRREPLQRPQSHRRPSRPPRARSRRRSPHRPASTLPCPMPSVARPKRPARFGIRRRSPGMPARVPTWPSWNAGTPTTYRPSKGRL